MRGWARALRATGASERGGLASRRRWWSIRPMAEHPTCFRKPRPDAIPEGAGNNNPKADSWEDFSYYIRCISRGVTGSIFPVIYGNGQQIVQGPGYVTIMQEMVHEARVIPTRRPSSCESEHPFLHGRPARPLGRQHAGRRDHEFPGQQDRNRPAMAAALPPATP